MTSKTNTLIFWDVGFDKGEMRGAIGCYFMADSMSKAKNLAQQFLTTGFPAATNVAQSMGIDDISPPISKQPYASDVVRSLRRNLKRSEQGLINPVFTIQSKLSLWQEVHETLKKMIVAQFQNQDFGNPVFVMAFSGARGNISQVRQLATMRGFMTDAEGNVVDYPIRSCFREGLTLTEYVISCFGARKGLVDTAVRTATAGYLTRRLVDVAQAITVSTFDCGTQNGILISDLQENSKVLLGLADRLLGRVLAENIFFSEISNQSDKTAVHVFGENEKAKQDSSLSNFLGDKNDKKRNILLRNTYISRVLATRVAKTKPYVLIRSPLSCRASKSVCQLCYGWSLAYGRAALIGEVVGIVAAQSIGEPGTQLTMRTFHTGGVFAGVGSIWEALPAPITGKILLPSNPLTGRLCYNAAGELSYLLTTTGVIGILGDKQKCWWMVCPPASQLFVRQGEIVRAGQKILEWPTNNWTNSVAHLLESKDKQLFPFFKSFWPDTATNAATNHFSGPNSSPKNSLKKNWFSSKRPPLSQRWLAIRAPEDGRLLYSPSKLFVQTLFFKKAKKKVVPLSKSLVGITDKAEITNENPQNQLRKSKSTGMFPDDKKNFLVRFVSSHSGYLQFQVLKKNSQNKNLPFLGGEPNRDPPIFDKESKEDSVLLLPFQSGTVLCAQPGQKVKKGELLALLPFDLWMQNLQTQPKQPDSALLAKRFTLTKKKGKEKDQPQPNKSFDGKKKNSKGLHQQPKIISEIEILEKDSLESVKQELPVVVSMDQFSLTRPIRAISGKDFFPDKSSSLKNTFQRNSNLMGVLVELVLFQKPKPRWWASIEVHIEGCLLTEADPLVKLRSTHFPRWFWASKRLRSPRDQSRQGDLIDSTSPLNLSAVTYPGWSRMAGFLESRTKKLVATSFGCPSLYWPVESIHYMAFGYLLESPLAFNKKPFPNRQMQKDHLPSYLNEYSGKGEKKHGYQPRLKSLKAVNRFSVYFDDGRVFLKRYFSFTQYSSFNKTANRNFSVKRLPFWTSWYTSKQFLPTTRPVRLLLGNSLRSNWPFWKETEKRFNLQIFPETSFFLGGSVLQTSPFQKDGIIQFSENRFSNKHLSTKTKECWLPSFATVAYATSRQGVHSPLALSQASTTVLGFVKKDSYNLCRQKLPLSIHASSFIRNERKISDKVKERNCQIKRRFLARNQFSFKTMKHWFKNEEESKLILLKILSPKKGFLNTRSSVAKNPSQVLSQPNSSQTDTTRKPLSHCLRKSHSFCKSHDFKKLSHYKTISRNGSLRRVLVKHPPSFYEIANTLLKKKGFKGTGFHLKQKNETSFFLLPPYQRHRFCRRFCRRTGTGLKKEAIKGLAGETKIFLPPLEYPFSVKSQRLFDGLTLKSSNKNKQIPINSDLSSEKRLHSNNKNIFGGKSWKGLTHLFCFLKKIKEPLNLPNVEKNVSGKRKKGLEKPRATAFATLSGSSSGLVQERKRTGFIPSEKKLLLLQEEIDRSYSGLFLSNPQLLLGRRRKLLFKRLKDSQSKISPSLRREIKKHSPLSYFKEIKNQELPKATAVNNLRNNSSFLTNTHGIYQLNSIKTIPGWFYLPLSLKTRSFRSQNKASANTKGAQQALAADLVDKGTKTLTSISAKNHKNRKTLFSGLCIKEDIPLQADMTLVSKITNLDTSLCYKKLLESKKHLKKLRVCNWQYQTEHRLFQKRPFLRKEKVGSRRVKLSPLLIRRAKEHSRWWFSNPRLFKKGILKESLSRHLNQNLVSNTLSSQNRNHKFSVLFCCQPKQRLSAFDYELIQTVPIRAGDDFETLKQSRTTKQTLRRKVFASKVKNKSSKLTDNLSSNSSVKNKTEADNLLKTKRKFPLPWGTDLKFLPFSTSLLKASLLKGIPQGSALASFLEKSSAAKAQPFKKKTGHHLKKESFPSFNYKNAERFFSQEWGKKAGTVSLHRQGLSSRSKNVFQLFKYKLFLDQRERVADFLYKRRKLVYSNQEILFGFSVTLLVSEKMPTLPPTSTVIKFGLAPHNFSRLLKHSFPLRNDSFCVENRSSLQGHLLENSSLKQSLRKPLYNIYGKMVHLFGKSFALKKFKKVETHLAIPSGMLLQLQDPPLGRDFIKQSFLLSGVQSFSNTRISPIQVTLMPFEGEWINRLKYATLASSGNFQIISGFREQEISAPSNQKAAAFFGKGFSASFNKIETATIALSKQSFSQSGKVFSKTNQVSLNEIKNQTYSFANKRQIPLNWLIFKENKEKALYKADKAISFNSFKDYILSRSLVSNTKEFTVNSKNKHSGTFNKQNVHPFPYNLGALETNQKLYIGGLLESEKPYPEFTKKRNNLYRIKRNGVLVQREGRKAIFQPCSGFPASVWNRLSLEQRQQGFLGEGQWLRVASFGRLTSEDITQGIPKVEQLFEARRRGQAMPMWVALSVMFRFLRQRYSVEDALNKSGPAVGVLLMEAIQRIYLSQGVLIADKHFEIVLKPVTNKLRVALFPNLRPALVKAKVQPLFAYVSVETLTGFADARNLAYSQNSPLSWLPKQPNYYRSVLGNALSGFAKTTINYLSPSSLANQFVNESIFTTQSYWENSGTSLSTLQEMKPTVVPKRAEEQRQVQERLTKTLQVNSQKLKQSPDSWFSKMLLKGFNTNNLPQSLDKKDKETYHAKKVREGLLVKEKIVTKDKAKLKTTEPLAVKWQEQRKQLLEKRYAGNKVLRSTPNLLLTFQSNAQWWFLELVNNVNQIPANPDIDSYDDLATEIWRPCLVGVTRAALGVESFLSSASFQETSRVLARSARVGRTDFLRGIKERVLIGVQLLAGTYLVNMANYNSSTLNDIDSRQIAINKRLNLLEQNDFTANKNLPFWPNNVNNTILVTSTLRRLQKRRFLRPQSVSQNKFHLNYNLFCQKLINTVRQAKGERPITDEEFLEWVNRSPN